MEQLTLSENLKRITKKMSLRRLAKDTAISANTLGNWLHGQVPSGAAGYSGLRKLSNYLHCSIETLMHGNIDETSEKVHSLSDLIKGDLFSGRFIVDLKVRRLPDDTQ